MLHGSAKQSIITSGQKTREASRSLEPRRGKRRYMWGETRRWGPPAPFPVTWSLGHQLRSQLCGLWATRNQGLAPKAQRGFVFAFLTKANSSVENDDWKSCRGHNTFNFFEINNSWNCLAHIYKDRKGTGLTVMCQTPDSADNFSCCLVCTVKLRIFGAWGDLRDYLVKMKKLRHRISGQDILCI